MPKLTFRRGRKIGDPNYSSTDVGLELEVQVDDEVFNDDSTFAKFVDSNYRLVDQLLEAEIAAIYAGRAPAREPEREPQRDRETAGARNGNGYHNGDREIDRARARDEPRNGEGGSERTRTDWNRNRRETERPRDDRRDDRRRGAETGKYGPPKTGSQLFAWAKSREEDGAEGFIKALGAWCKKNDMPWRFNDLSSADIRAVYEAGREMLDDVDLY